MSGVRVDAAGVIGSPDAAFPLIEQVVDTAMAAICAEAVGAMASMHELTVDYMKTRKQFGVAIGGFQVLQHRAADMLIALEQARSMAMLATMMAAEDDVRERRQAISAAKVQIGRSGRFIGQQAIQIHGGIGMTMEASIGHYFKRVTMIDAMFGDADHHLGIVAETGGLIRGVTTYLSRGSVMLFPMSDRAQEVSRRVTEFMDAHVYAAEPVYAQQLDGGASRWAIPPVIDELKAKAKADWAVEPVSAEARISRRA